MIDIQQRQISLSREGGTFRVAFPYHEELVKFVKTLPNATFDGQTKTWTATVCAQSRDALAVAYRNGLVDVDPDSLIGPEETLETISPASLRAGSARRPFYAHIAIRDDALWSKLSAIPGSRWEKAAQAISYPASASASLAELVERGVLDDPNRLLSPSDVTISYDSRTGEFKTIGDQRAASVFSEHFPQRDVIAEWREKGLDVGFSDTFTEEMYAGEIARRSNGIQPAGMKLELFPYQQVDVAVALERSGLLIGHTMGCGKTAIAIATGFELLNRGEVSRVLAVVPAALRTQWRNEILRFTGEDDARVVVIDGAKKQRMEAWEQAKDARWVVVHYNALTLKDDKTHLEALASGSLLIADEVHRVKNHNAKSTRVMQSLAKKAARRIGLSGTPVENSPSEWFNIVSEFLNPGVFGSPTDFLNRYSYPANFGGYQGARNIDELRRRSQPLYVRRTLNEVAEHLPRQRVNTVVLEPRPEYAAALQRAHREARDEIAAERVKKSSGRFGVLDGVERDELEAGAEMTAVGLLKRLCTSPRLILDSEAESAQTLVESGLIPDEDGPKLDEVRAMAAEMHTAGERLVVFTASKKFAYLLAERLKKDGITYVTFTGDSSTQERDEAVAAFTTPATDDNAGPTVFVATDAGAEGLNLGRCCSTLVNVDLPWTPGRLGQRNARVRRIDSTQESFLVVNLVLAGTIEAGILRMVEHKADLADAILGESGGRKSTTGRGGRNIFETALSQWESES